MRRILITLLLLLLALPVVAHGPEGEGPSEEHLKKLFPAADAFVTKPLKLEGTVRSSIEQRLGAKLEGHDLTASAYVATAKGRSLGVAWMTDAHLGKGFADVLVGVSLDGKIVGVLLDHSPVPSLSGSSYLKQYQGLSADSPFVVGGDLKAAPKQEAASKILAGAVKKAVLVVSVAVLKK